jgi:hypothetical protein
MRPEAEEFLLRHHQGRHPAGVVLVDSPRQADEPPLLGPILDRLDANLCHVDSLAAAGFAAPRPAAGAV